MRWSGIDGTAVGPIYYDRANVWHVTKYADLREALRSSDLGPNFRMMLARHAATSQMTTLLLRGSPIFMSGAAGAHVRALVVAALRRRITESLRESVMRIASDLVAQVEPGVEVEAVGDIADRLPAQVIGHLMGMPAELGQSVCQHAAVLGKGSTESFPSMARMRELEASARELTRLLRPVLAERCATPGDDFLSDIVAARDSHTLDDEGLLALTAFLLTAAQVTTSSFISAIIDALTSFPAPLAAIGADQQLRRGFLNEVLRLTTPLQIILRKSLRDTLIADANVPAGAGIMLHLSRGNRDPAEFTSPDALLPGRANVLNNVAFGAGRHACPGARLAMLEGDVLARVLTSRFRQISAERDGQLERHPALKSFAELPVTFHV